MVVPKKHDDLWDVAVAIFDWEGRLAPILPKGTWFVFDHGEDVEVVQHCVAPAPCVCNAVTPPTVGRA